MRLSDAQVDALMEFDRQERSFPGSWGRRFARPSTVWSLARLGLVEARDVFPSGGTQGRILPAGQTVVSEILAETP